MSKSKTRLDAQMAKAWLDSIEAWRVTHTPGTLDWCEQNDRHVEVMRDGVWYGLCRCDEREEVHSSYDTAFNAGDPVEFYYRRARLGAYVYAYGLGAEDKTPYFCVIDTYTDG